jgi:hypothetical protein
MDSTIVIPPEWRLVGEPQGYLELERREDVRR